MGLKASVNGNNRSPCKYRLAELDMEYIDLLLLHTPGNPQLRAETWKALESAFSQVWCFCRSG